MASGQTLFGILEAVVYPLKFLCETLSVLCVGAGILSVLALVLGVVRHSREYTTILQTVRLKFGTFLSIALEFQLAADILATTIKHDLQSLGELALLAVIRTFLNYFLQKEMEAEKKLVREQLACLTSGDT